MNSMALVILAISILAVNLVNAHGYVNFPRTRGWIKYGGDPVSDYVLSLPGSGNWIAPRGWPVPGGAGAMRPDPMTLQPIPSNLQTILQPGPLTIIWQWNDGANHIGICTAYLRRRNDPSVNVLLSNTTNCARSLYAGTIGTGTMLATPSFMQLTLPSGYESYDDCYLWIQVEARHTVPTELYQDVADFTWGTTPATNSIPSELISSILRGWKNSKFISGLNMALLPSSPGVSGGQVIFPNDNLPSLTSASPTTTSSVSISPQTSTTSTQNVQTTPSPSTSFTPSTSSIGTTTITTSTQKLASSFVATSTPLPTQIKLPGCGHPEAHKKRVARRVRVRNERMMKRAILLNEL